MNFARENLRNEKNKNWQSIITNSDGLGIYKKLLKPKISNFTLKKVYGNDV